MSNFPCSLTRNITSLSMENLTFHSLLRWKMIILQILATSLMHFLFKRLGERTFELSSQSRDVRPPVRDVKKCKRGQQLWCFQCSAGAIFQTPRKCSVLLRGHLDFSKSPVHLRAVYASPQKLARPVMRARKLSTLDLTFTNDPMSLTVAVG